VDPHAPDSPDSPVRKPEGDLGKGPLLGKGAADAGASLDLINRLREAAQEVAIPIQEVGYGKLHDGKPFTGEAVAVVGVPIRFPGTPVETLDMEDLDSLARWLRRYLEEGP